MCVQQFLQNCGKFDEMTCSQNRNGLGLHLCRKKSDDAEPCIRDEDCMPPLKCNGSYPYRQCYNPKLTLSFGQSCNPDAKASKKRCIIADDGYSLGCLPKNKGYVCQKMADMYERCDVRKNVGCSPFSKTLCSNDGVCVPRA